MGFVPKRASNEMLFEALLMVLSGGVYLPATPAAADTAAPLSDASRSAMLDEPAGEPPTRTVLPQGAPHERLAREDAGVDHAATIPGGLHPRAQLASPAVPPGALAPPMPASSQRGPARTAQQVFETLGLTPRQLDALRLLLLGYSNKQIARELNLSVETVKDHVAAVLRALGVNSRTQAVLAVNQLLQRDGPP
jgi:DNA-binding NarL/FixJ family response regulator